MHNTVEKIRTFFTKTEFSSRLNGGFMRGARRISFSLLPEARKPATSGTLTAEELDSELQDISQAITNINARIKFHKDITNPAKPLRIYGTLAMGPRTDSEAP